MEQTIFLSAFGLIFLAELGDKTQLVTASQAAQHSVSLTGMSMVFVSSAPVLWCVSLLGMLPGSSWFALYRSPGFTEPHDSCFWCLELSRSGS